METSAVSMSNRHRQFVICAPNTQVAWNELKLSLLAWLQNKLVATDIAGCSSTDECAPSTAPPATRGLAR